MPKSRYFLRNARHLPPSPRAKWCRHRRRHICRGRIEVVVQNLAAPIKIEQSLLADGDFFLVVVPSRAGCLRQFGDLRLRIGPRLLGGVAYQSGHPQSELKRRQIAVKIARQLFQTLDPHPDALKRLAPEQLHIRVGGGHTLGSLGSAAEIKLGMAALPRGWMRGSTVEPATRKCSPS